MAIQVSGTEVISNARNLNNIAAIDATTKTTLQNAGLGAMAFIESQDASASATLDFTGFDATKYDSYVFELSNLVCSAASNGLFMRTSSDAGSTYDSTAGNYNYALRIMDMLTGETVDLAGDNNSTVAMLSDDTGLGETVDGASGYSGTVKIRGPHLAKATFIGIDGEYETATEFVKVSGGAVRTALADVDAVRFQFSIDNIASGTITMYGLRNS